MYMSSPQRLHSMPMICRQSAMLHLTATTGQRAHLRKLVLPQQLLDCIPQCPCELNPNLVDAVQLQTLKDTLLTGQRDARSNTPGTTLERGSQWQANTRAWRAKGAALRTHNGCAHFRAVASDCLPCRAMCCMLTPLALVCNVHQQSPCLTCCLLHPNIKAKLRPNITQHHTYLQEIDAGAVGNCQAVHHCKHDFRSIERAWAARCAAAKHFDHLAAQGCCQLLRNP